MKVELRKMDGKAHQQINKTPKKEEKLTNLEKLLEIYKK
jgi:hypothetical protein